MPPCRWPCQHAFVTCSYSSPVSLPLWNRNNCAGYPCAVMRKMKSCAWVSDGILYKAMSRQGKKRTRFVEGENDNNGKEKVMSPRAGWAISMRPSLQLSLVLSGLGRRRSRRLFDSLRTFLVRTSCSSNVDSHHRRGRLHTQLARACCVKARDDDASGST